MDEKPIIPATSIFLLTSDSTQVPPPQPGATDPDLSRYFDRPEVIESYTAQEAIQVPDYQSLPDDALVNGRLRLRAEIVVSLSN